MTRIDAADDGDAVHDAAVEHRDAVDLGNLGHEGQRTAGLGNARQPLVVVTLRKIHGAPRAAVGSHHLKRGRVLLIRLIVEGNNLLGKTLVEDFRVEDATVDNEAAQRDVVVLLQHVDIRVAGAARLTTHIRQSVASACRHGDDIGEVHLVLHQRVEHARSEHATHASALEHQSCIGCNLHF